MKMGNQEQRFICGLKMAVVALTDLAVGLQLFLAMCAVWIVIYWLILR